MLPDVRGAVTRMERLAEEPFPRLVIFQVTVLVVLEVVPIDAVTSTRLTSGGRVSVTLTPVASSGPLLVILIL